MDKPSLRVVSSPDEPPRYILTNGRPASDHQAAIFDFVRDPRGGSAIVKAVAGSGKTTTVKNCLPFIDEGRSVLLIAFNKPVADELRAAIDEMGKAVNRPFRGVRAATFHSLGYGALLKLFGNGAKAEIDRAKCRKILKEALSEEEFPLYGGFCAKLVAYAKGEGIGALVPDIDERWYELIDHHGIHLDSDEATLERAVHIARRTLLRSSRWAKEKRLIDYDDMLYLPILWKLRLWKNDFVVIDEAQDTSPVRRALARLALLPSGRLIAVGDPCQAIYGFTGASTDAMDLIARDFRTRELPLTVSYRCATAIVERAKVWVDYIEAAPGAVAGEVLDGLSEEDALAALTDEDAILCRQTAPLVEMAYRLIAAGRGCRVLGKEIGEGLIDLIRAQKARGIDRLVTKLEAWADRESARATAKGDETGAEAIADRFACVMTIIRALPETERTIPALERRIETLFSDGDNIRRVLTLATVHKSKGLEWNTVAILRPDLMPSRAARTEWQYQQEINLQYVAATRAKTTLIYMG